MEGETGHAVVEEEMREEIEVEIEGAIEVTPEKSTGERPDSWKHCFKKKYCYFSRRRRHSSDRSDGSRE